MLIRARIALVAALFVSRAAVAQNHDYAPLVLRIPSSTRYLAMGNAAMGSRDDDVLFYNPAQIAVARGMSVSGEQFSSQSRSGALSSVARFSSGGVAIGAQILSGIGPGNEYPVSRLALDPAVGGANITSVALTAGIAQVYKGVRAGLAGKFVEDNFATFRFGRGSENLASYRLGRGLVDLGLSKDLYRRYTFGLALQNLGGHTTTEGHSIDLPTRLAFGATGGEQAGPFDLLMTAEVSALRGGFVAPAGGAELSYSWLDGYAIAFRAGARRPAIGEKPLTVGVGLAIDRLSIDYALETLDSGPARNGFALDKPQLAHRIGLRIR